MRISVLAVGRFGGSRAKPSPERTLFDHYAARITWPFDLLEVEEKRTVSTPERMRREAELLNARIPDGARVIVLDAGGRVLASEDLAARLQVWRDDGVRDLVFVIGGADGLAEELKHRADLVLSFGKATWPHLLVRALVAEQVYRAQCILSGHPYHRS